MLSVTYKPFMLNVMLSVIYKPFMLNVITLSVIYKPFMLNVIMLNVVMLSVVAPFLQRRLSEKVVMSFLAYHVVACAPPP